MKYIIPTIVLILVITGIIFYAKSKDAIAPTGPLACTLDAKICPDGSAVGRIAPDCEFEACPAETPKRPMGFTSEELQNQDTTVRYTVNGFVPPTLTVAVGTTVTFVNESGQDMWVGADEHPTHTQYAGTTLRDHCPDTSKTAFDQCSIGNSFSFTFTRAGNWEYHNHRNASHVGTIKVVVPMNDE